MESPNQESGQEQAAADRRRAARQSLVTKALVYPDQPCANPQRVALRDISLLGVAFDSAVPFEPDQRLRLRVEAGPMHMAARMRVTACRACGDDLFAVGAEFVQNELDVLDGKRMRVTADSLPTRHEVIARNPCRDLKPRVSRR